MAAKKNGAKKTSAKKSTAKKASVTKAERVRNQTSNDARGAAEAAAGKIPDGPAKKASPAPAKKVADDEDDTHLSNTETTTIGPPEEIESDEDAEPMNYDEDGGGVPETDVR